MTPAAGPAASHTPAHMIRTSLRACGPLLAAALAVCVTACGGDNIPKAIPESGATLEGTVKAGGEQLQFAMITVKSGNGTSTGKIGDDGRYKVTNVPVGEVQVAVNTSAAMGDYTSAAMGAGAMTGGPDGKTGRKKTEVKMIHLKEQYFDPATSGLKTTVNAGANTFDIELPAGARK